MTQRTINLYDGLEALYYFDSDYYDGTTGEIKDKSGHGRHAKAFGGPTVGVNGPNDFEAASLDGNDDYFDVGEPVEVTGTETVFATVKPTSLDESGYFDLAFSNFSNNQGVGSRIGFFQDKALYSIYDDSNSLKEANKRNITSGEWYSMIGLYDGSNIRLLINEEVSEKISVSSRTPSSLNAKVGTQQDGGDTFEGKIGIVGKWSRALSYSEIQALNDLTAPRRSQL